MKYAPRPGSLTEQAVQAIRDHGPIRVTDLARLLKCSSKKRVASHLLAPAAHGLVKRVDTAQGVCWAAADWKPAVRLPDAPVSIFTFRG